MVAAVTTTITAAAEDKEVAAAVLIVCTNLFFHLFTCLTTNSHLDAPPQSSNGAPPPSSGSAPPQSSGGSAQPSSGGSSDASSGASSGSNSAPPPSSGSDSKSDAQTTAPPSSQYTDSIAAGAQPGGINMITPNTQSTATQYYKVDQTITWVWNYTSLSRAPQAIDILATVSGTASGANPSPFTLATNYSFAPTETFTWDTGKYANETSTLPMGMYTLLVYDAGAPDGVSATASPGYLGLYNQFHFGMYPTQSPTALATPYQCATCNSARSSMESLTVTGLVAIVAMTVASFVVFANGFGVA